MTAPASSPDTRPPFSVYFAVFLVSASALAYEIHLTRLFSIIQWHHYAYMVISLALLGFGASGTFLAIYGHRLLGRFRASFAAAASLFAVASLTCFVAVQRVPLNPMSLVWDRAQIGWLAVVYVALMVPFFFASGCIALTFMRYRSRLSSIYAADLVGAGAGAIVVVVFLFWLTPESTLQLISWMSLAAVAVVLWPGLRPRARLAVSGALLVLLVGSLTVKVFHLQPSQYKALSRTLAVSGAEVVHERSGPLGLVTAVASPRVPFRYAPGLSLNAPGTPARQIALFTDADSMSVVTHNEGSMTALAYLSAVPQALAYWLLDEPSVLVVGSAGGLEVLRALQGGAGGVVALEPNAMVVGLLRGELKAFSGDIYGDSRVRVREEDVRGFAARTAEQFDLIQIAALGGTSGGRHGLGQGYSYTIEALSAYLDRLRPQGVLSVSRRVRLPPRDSLKLFATALSVLERSGVADPAARLVWIRSWSTSTLLIKNGEWSQSELNDVRAFCERFAFDPVYFPGISPDEVNRFNSQRQPWFHRAALALLSAERTAFIEKYQFDIRPAIDDRPYFGDFFRWRTVPELLDKLDQGSATLIDMGYIIVVITLAQALLASVLLIIAPLLVRTGRAEHPPARIQMCVLGYFSLIGLGFLLLEIAFVEKFGLFLSHPIYAVTVTLAAFLVGSGIGSGWSERMRTACILRPAIAVFAVGVCYLFVLERIFELFAWSPGPVRFAIASVLILPLAVPMGMMFPLGLRALADCGESIVPWAWAVNGCASVVGAVLAVLLATHFGFSAVVLWATALYPAAGLLGLWMNRAGSARSSGAVAS